MTNKTIIKNVVQFDMRIGVLERIIERLGTSVISAKELAKIRREVITDTIKKYPNSKHIFD